MGFLDADPMRNLTCGKCGIRFAIPESFYQWLLADSDRGFSCPKGHKRYFTQEENEREKLRRERDRWKHEAGREGHRRQNAEERERAAERRLTAQKGHTTRLRKKIAATEGEKP